MIPTALVCSLALAAPDLHVRPPAEMLDLHLGSSAGAERSTQAAIIGAAVALLVVEVLIIRARDAGRPDPTISEVMRDWGEKYGAVPWTAGVMAGHWFWNGAGPASDREARSNAMLLVWTSSMVVAWDFADHRGKTPWRGPLLAAGGFLAGHFLWQQPTR